MPVLKALSSYWRVSLSGWQIHRPYSICPVPLCYHSISVYRKADPSPGFQPHDKGLAKVNRNGSNST